MVVESLRSWITQNDHTVKGTIVTIMNGDFKLWIQLSTLEHGHARHRQHTLQCTPTPDTNSDHVPYACCNSALLWRHRSALFRKECTATWSLVHSIDWCCVNAPETVPHLPSQKAWATWRSTDVEGRLREPFCRHSRIPACARLGRRVVGDRSCPTSCIAIQPTLYTVHVSLSCMRTDADWAKKTSA